MIELASKDQLSAFELPYPASIQLALDRVVLTGLTHGGPTPTGVPELLAWCRRPGLAGWPLELPGTLLTADARLIHPAVREPTRTCAELASHGPQSVTEQEAEALLTGLADICGTVERFMACRDFLIQRPVILRFDPMELLQPARAQTWNLVKGLYGPLPTRFAADELVHCCTGCGLLAKPVTKEGPWCEGGCPSEGREFVMSHEPRLSRALPLSLRLLLALPGRIEQAVRARFRERPRLIPLGLGVHRVNHPDGTPRVFQVHDREQPGLAALRAAETATRLGEPLSIVVPDGPAYLGYRRRFELALPTDAQVQIVSASEFTAPGPARARRNHA
ncbi:hypothetical protein FFZ77_24255 [Streptomyces katsurahamanus]|uniref:pPIWI-RE three-gene island domain-containing protein n=1 Tax=Streptomyces katsurahamanus TaxID=2577098 RepID=A0ABW9NZ34_9ACTN|nr:hypothetical protein [Streptomyces katsurahamanus]